MPPALNALNERLDFIAAGLKCNRGNPSDLVGSMTRGKTRLRCHFNSFGLAGRTPRRSGGAEADGVSAATQS